MNTGYAAAYPYVAPGSLSELNGPASGRVTLPGHLGWGPRRTYDLDEFTDVRLFSMRVIRESASVEDLRRFLNADVLRRVWPHLVLPPRPRALWENRFHELARAA